MANEQADQRTSGPNDDWTYETLLVDRADGIVTVTINRPRRKNAATTTTWRELGDVFRRIGSSRDDRVVIVTGAGDDFCSGADLSGDEDRSKRDSLLSMRVVNAACMALHHLPQPSIARVRGVAVGAGCNLALTCDLLVADETARFAEIFVRRGLSVDFGASWLLPRRVGLHKAKELALFGDIIGAAEADRIGLINKLVPDGELDATVDEWAKRLAAGPPIAMSMTKQLINNGLNATLEQALEAEGQSQSLNFTTPDTAEAMAAFIEKRDPKFSGR